MSQFAKLTITSLSIGAIASAAVTVVTLSIEPPPYALPLEFSFLAVLSWTLAWRLPHRRRRMGWLGVFFATLTVYLLVIGVIRYLGH